MKLKFICKECGTQFAYLHSEDLSSTFKIDNVGCKCKRKIYADKDTDVDVLI